MAGVDPLNAHPNITVRNQSIRIRYPDLFIKGETRRFTKAIFGLSDVDHLKLDPSKHQLEILLTSGGSSARDALLKLSELLNQPVTADYPIPSLNTVSPQTLKRWRQLITSLDLMESEPGRVKIKYQRTAAFQPSGGEIERQLSGLPGVLSVRARRLTKNIEIRFDQDVNPDTWIRTLERLFSTAPSALSHSKAAKVPFLAANTNLVLSTGGQFFFPAAIPIASTILVLTRIPHIRKATRELTKGKVGSPFFGCVVLACSVAGHAPFASALAEWLGCIWEKRWRSQILKESKILLSEIEPYLVECSPDIKTLPVHTGEITAFDGILSDGDILLQDVMGDPLLVPVIRKRKGDAIASGYRVIGGSGTLTRSNASGPHRLQQIVDTIAALPQTLHEDPLLIREARRVADKPVYPNLAIAGVAVATGGLHMASAVLHQDWSQSPMIAAPTEFFRDVRSALRRGALVSSPQALKTLGQTPYLIIDVDYPHLDATRPLVTDIEVGSSSENLAHRWALALAGWVGDERSEALVDLARAMKSEPIDARLIGFEGGSTILEIEGRSVHLVDLPSETSIPSLRIEIENGPTETLHFSPSDASLHAGTFEQLRALGLTPLLTSPKGSLGRTQQLARQLGIDHTEQDLTTCLQALRSQGTPTALLVGHTNDETIQDLADVRISPVSTLDQPKASITLIGESISELPRLVIAARTLPLRVGIASLKTLPTNLLCILGAFSGNLTGTTATVLAHTGVMGVSVQQGRKMKQRTR